MQPTAARRWPGGDEEEAGPARSPIGRRICGRSSRGSSSKLAAEPPEAGLCREPSGESLHASIAGYQPVAMTTGSYGCLVRPFRQADVARTLDRPPLDQTACTVEAASPVSKTAEHACDAVQVARIGRRRHLTDGLLELQACHAAGEYNAQLVLEFGDLSQRNGCANCDPTTNAAASAKDPWRR